MESRFDAAVNGRLLDSGPRRSRVEGGERTRAGIEIPGQKGNNVYSYPTGTHDIVNYGL